MDVSICMSTYNRKELLRETLLTLSDIKFSGEYEIILMDDGSVDDSKSMVEKEFPFVKYFYKENCGDASAKNAATAQATGKYIVFFDSDDPVHSECIQELYDMIQTHGGNCCSYGQYHTKIDENNNETVVKKKKKRQYPSGNIATELFMENIVHNCGTMIPLEAFRESGGLDESLKVSYDYKLFLKMSLDYEFFPINTPVIKRRYHGSNLSSPDYSKVIIRKNILQGFLEYEKCRGLIPEDKIAKRLSKANYKLFKMALADKKRPLAKAHLKDSLALEFTFKRFIYLLFFPFIR